MDELSGTGLGPPTFSPWLGSLRPQIMCFSSSIGGDLPPAEPAVTLGLQRASDFSETVPLSLDLLCKWLRLVPPADTWPRLCETWREREREREPCWITKSESDIFTRNILSCCNIMSPEYKHCNITCMLSGCDHNIT